MEKEFFEDVAAMEQDYRSFERAAFEEFQREIEAMWGDFVASTDKDWVEYSEDKTGRSKVDFESGDVVVEVMVPKEKAQKDPQIVKKELFEEIERLVVDKGKSRDYSLPVEAFPEPVSPPTREKEIPPEPLLPTPVLDGQLQDKKGNPITEENKKEFAQEVIETETVVQEEVKTEKGEMVKAQVTFSLVPDHLRVRAERYLDPIKKNAGRFNISVPLAFAVIHTESFFNPKATSHVPAYGLMQLVPKSGGLDAYRSVYGKDKILSADYLYNPENNIELGCAYLGLLKNRYFKGIHQEEKALYCAIASYNTGAGNLSRALCGRKDLRCAIDRANAMELEALFSHIKLNLPYQETRDYLVRVSERMSLYKEWE
ncbi:murein transglycosylase domain-containing protein [Thermodesulfobacteriota bacterium]